MKNLLLLLGTLVSLTSFTQVGNIRVQVNSLKSEKGAVLIYLYQNENGFPTDPKKAWKAVKVAIESNAADHTFTNIPFGNYAVTIAHDENGNDVLDTNFIGIPKEGIGTSNNAKGSFGSPRFADAKFQHQKNETLINIKVSY